MTTNHPLSHNPNASPLAQEQNSFHFVFENLDDSRESGPFKWHQGTSKPWEAWEAWDTVGSTPLSHGRVGTRNLTESVWIDSGTKFSNSRRTTTTKMWKFATNALSRTRLGGCGDPARQNSAKCQRCGNQSIRRANSPSAS